MGEKLGNSQDKTLWRRFVTKLTNYLNGALWSEDRKLIVTMDIKNRSTANRHLNE